MFSNATGFAAQAVPFFDARGSDVVLVIAKATFHRRGQKLLRADDQVPVRLADVPTDAAAIEAGRQSSVRYPSDVGGEKPGADVVIVGGAVSPKPVTSLDLAIRAPGLSVTLRVHGERVYTKAALGLKFGPSAPFERSPVTYERAYGGTSQDGSVVDWRNPVGRGVHHHRAELDGAPAPCVEDPAHPVEAVRDSVPVGFGALPTFWVPRRDFAGTMDSAWKAARMPLPPLDFDPRFHQVAHPSLQVARPLVEGDVLATHGMSNEPLFDVTVPSLSLVAHCRFSASAAVTLPLLLDTALLEPEEGRVEFTYRRVVPLGRAHTFLREVRLDVA